MKESDFDVLTRFGWECTSCGDFNEVMEIPSEGEVFFCESCGHEEEME